MTGSKRPTPEPLDVGLAGGDWGDLGAVMAGKREDARGRAHILPIQHPFLEIARQIRVPPFAISGRPAPHWQNVIRGAAGETIPHAIRVRAFAVARVRRIERVG